MKLSSSQLRVERKRRRKRIKRRRKKMAEHRRPNHSPLPAQVSRLNCPKGLIHSVYASMGRSIQARKHLKSHDGGGGIRLLEAQHAQKKTGPQKAGPSK